MLYDQLPRARIRQPPGDLIVVLVGFLFMSSLAQAGWGCCALSAQAGQEGQPRTQLTFCAGLDQMWLTLRCPSQK